jgi:hypothetical protein
MVVPVSCAESPQEADDFGVSNTGPQRVELFHCKDDMKIACICLVGDDVLNCCGDCE